MSKLETIDKKIDEQAKKMQTYDKLKIELIESEYKSKLKEHMENRLFELQNKLKTVDRDNRLTTIELNDLMRGKNIYGGSMKYSVDELVILFDYYREFIRKINEKVRYVPTKPNFCGFIGISTSTYNAYKIDKDEKRRDIMNLIDDFIMEIQLSLAQNKEIDTIVTMFRMKSEHGLIEATAPTVIREEHTFNIEQAKRNIKVLSSGGTLQTIELGKKDYSVDK